MGAHFDALGCFGVRAAFGALDVHTPKAHGKLCPWALQASLRPLSTKALSTHFAQRFQTAAGATRTTHTEEVRGEFAAIDTALARLQPGDLCLVLVDQVEEALAHLALRCGTA